MDNLNKIFVQLDLVCSQMESSKKNNISRWSRQSEKNGTIDFFKFCSNGGSAACKKYNSNVVLSQQGHFHLKIISTQKY